MGEAKARGGQRLQKHHVIPRVVQGCPASEEWTVLDMVSAGRVHVGGQNGRLGSNLK